MGSGSSPEPKSEGPNNIRANQSCLSWPLQKNLEVTETDWRAAMPNDASFHYISGCKDCVSLTEQGALRLRLDPTPNGSTHIDAGLNIPARRVYTLSQTLLFEDGFDWGGTRKAGKIGFGLAAGSRPSGGQEKEDGYTARLMWRSANDGTDPERPNHTHIALYSYAADRRQNIPYGDDYALQGFEPVPGEAFSVTIEIGGNSAAGTPDGYAKAWINGTPALDRQGIMWTKTGAPPLIDKLSMSTFHGGNSAAYAPSRTNHIQISDVCYETRGE